jgi:4-hydroxy-3-polyprenylbenzoate decarboxylase
LFNDRSADARLLHRRRVSETLPAIFKMNFPEIVEIALQTEGVFNDPVFASIRKSYPIQAYKIMHGLRGMGQMMFTKCIVVVVDDECWRTATNVDNTSEVLFCLRANI